MVVCDPGRYSNSPSFEVQNTLVSAAKSIYKTSLMCKLGLIMVELLALFTGR
jgi:hypothetical protein